MTVTQEVTTTKKRRILANARQTTASIYGERGFTFGRVAPDIYVNGDTAITYGPVFSCIRLISSAISSMPINQFWMREGVKTNITSDLTYLLNVQPNPEISSLDFFKTLLTQSLLWGSSYAEIERDIAGRPIALWGLETERMTPKRQSRTDKLYYEYYNAQGDRVYLEPDDILHVKCGISYDGISCWGPLQLAGNSIGLGIAAETFGLSYFANGAVPGGIIQNPAGKLSEEGIKNLLSTFNEQHQGPVRAHRVMYLDMGMEYKPLTVPLETAQFLESRTFQVEEIARWFGVPPHKLGILERATASANVEQQNLQYVGDTLVPVMSQMESEFNIKLLSKRMRGTQFFKFDPTSLLRGDLHSRYTAYATAIQWGFMSRNEVRAKEDLNPLEYLDSPLVPVNMMTAEQLEEKAEAEDLLADQQEMQLGMEESEDDTEEESDSVDMIVSTPDAEVSDLSRLEFLERKLDILLDYIVQGRQQNLNLSVSQPAINLAPTISLSSPAVNIQPPTIHVDARTVVEPQSISLPAIDIKNAYTMPSAQVPINVEVLLPENPAPDIQITNQYTMPATQVPVNVDVTLPENPAPEVLITNQYTMPATQVPVNVDVNLPENPDIQITNQYTLPEIKSPDVVVNVDAPNVTVEGPVITVEPSPPPVAEITIQNEQPAPVIEFKPNIEVAPSPAPDVHIVNEVPQVTVNAPKGPVERIVMEKDKEGFPIRIVERPIQ